MKTLKKPNLFSHTMLALLMFVVGIVQAQAQTTTLYDFESETTLTDDFDVKCDNSNGSITLASTSGSNTGNAPTGSTKCAYVVIGGTSQRSAYLTTKASFENVSEITFYVDVYDRGKTSLAVQMSTDPTFTTDVANVLTLTLCDSAPLSLAKNKQFYPITLSVPNLNGYVRFQFYQPKSSGKLMWLDNLTITTAAPSVITPSIDTQPEAQNILQGGTANLSIAASTTSGGTLSYQWYSSTTNNTADGVLLTGKTNATLSVSPTENTYYFCVVTDGSNSESITSDVVLVSVKKAYYIAGTTALTGHDWSANATPLDENYEFTTTLQGLSAAENYRFKITDGTWGNSWGYNNYYNTDGASNFWVTDPENGNIQVDVSAITGDVPVTIKFDPENARITIRGNYYLMGNGTESNNWCCGKSWATGCELTKQEDGNYAISTTLGAGTYDFKVLGGNIWHGYDQTTACCGITSNGGNVHFTLAQSSDITIQINDTTGNIDFTSSTLLCSDETWTVAGDSAFFGSKWSWSPTATANDMVVNGLVYEKTYQNVTLPAGNIEYKVVKDHAWTTSYPSSNATLNIPSAGNYDVTFTYDPCSHAVAATATSLNVSDTYIWKQGSSYGGCVATPDATANANQASTDLTYSTSTITGADAMKRPNAVGTVFRLTIAAKSGYAISSLCTYGKLEEAAGAQYSWDGGSTWTTLVKYTTEKALTLSAPTGATSFIIKYTCASTSSGGLWWRNALVNLYPYTTSCTTPQRNYNLTADNNNLCPGESVTLGLDGSQSGVNYVLYANDASIETVAGTGSAISFAPQTPTEKTEYKVKTTDDGGYCPSDINEGTTSTQTVHVGTETLLKATITGKTTAKVSGTIGGTAAVSASSTDYKLGTDGNYFSFTLANGNYLQAGQELEIEIYKASDIGTKMLYIYTGTKDSHTLLAEINHSVGKNYYTLPDDLPANTSSICIYRDDSNQNPYLVSMSLTQPNCSLTFDNHAGDNKWSNIGNWAPNYTHMPTINQNVSIEAPVTVDIDTAVASTIRICSDCGGVITVNSKGSLQAKQIGRSTSATPNALQQTEPADLVLLAANGKTGTVTFGSAIAPYATVQLHSIAYTDNSSSDTQWNWQYIGSPISEATAATALNQFYGSWIYGFDENGWQTIGASNKAKPFVGYAHTQVEATGGKTFTFSGQLLNGSQTLPLSYTSDATYAGFNLLANSFAAPIDITKLQATDFVNAEATVNIFNTGSYSQWDSIGQIHGETPGQYLQLPISSVAAMDSNLHVIPAMQGFVVQATAASASLKLDYNQVVWPRKVATTPNQPLHVQQKASAASDFTVLRINVQGSRLTDKVYIMENAACTRAYDNGYDARKMFGSSLAPQLFAVESGEYMAVDVRDSLANTLLGFVAGEDTNYTLTFGQGSDNAATRLDGTLYLHDLVAKQVVPITPEASYSFTSTASDEEGRFLLSEQSSIGHQGGDATSIKTVDGTLWINGLPSDATVHIYDTLGRLMLTKHIDAQQSISLNSLPKGSYVVRLTCAQQTYTEKIVLL